MFLGDTAWPDEYLELRLVRWIPTTYEDLQKMPSKLVLAALAAMRGEGMAAQIKKGWHE